jgi:hypothetical protein
VTVPVTAPVVTGSILAAGAGLVGPKWLALTGAMGFAVEQWVLAGGVLLAGVTTGTAGGGGVVGAPTSLFFPPQPLPVSAANAAVGILGPTGQLASAAIGIGVANALTTTAGYAGVSIGVGVGTDLSKVVYADPVLLTGLLTANFAVVGIVGPTAQRLAGGVGAGLATLALTGTSVVPGIVTGAPAPGPAVGTSNSKVV